jgi:lysophospholipase L1-like esterase
MPGMSFLRHRSGPAARPVVAIALAACVVLAACDGSRTPLPPKSFGANGPTIVPPTDPLIRYVGRWDTSDPAVARAAWSAAAFTFRFGGTTLGLAIEDTALPDGTPDDDWVAVSLDGRELPPIALSEGRRTYEIARGLAAGSHEVAVAKRTEAEVGTIGLRGIALDPGASLGARPAAPPRILEIVGDSISTGFGVLGPNADCPFSAATEDATRTYGALAARDLGADVWIAAWKGKGVLRNDVATDADTIPRLYERLLPGVPGSRYDFAVQPDVVVLNIGTNDFARTAPPDAEFREAYAAFVARLRTLHPKALLVLALGPMLFDEGDINFRTLARAAIAATIADARKQGDEKIAMIEFWSDPADGAGCQVHPSLATHRRMADQLVRLLEAKLGWKRI